MVDLAIDLIVDLIFDLDRLHRSLTFNRFSLTSNRFCWPGRWPDCWPDCFSLTYRWPEVNDEVNEKRFEVNEKQSRSKIRSTMRSQVNKNDSRSTIYKNWSQRRGQRNDSIFFWIEVNVTIVDLDFWRGQLSYLGIVDLDFSQSIPCLRCSTPMLHIISYQKKHIKTPQLL